MEKNLNPRYYCAVLLVKNVEKSKKFFSDILGQEIKMDFGRSIEFTGGFSIWDKSFALKMMGLGYKDNFIQSNEVELYFEIEDLDAIFAELKKENIKFIHDIIDQPWAQRCFRIYDPDNHIIELGEPMTVTIERLYNDGLTHNQIIKKTTMPKNMF